MKTIITTLQNKIFLSLGCILLLFMASTQGLQAQGTPLLQSPGNSILYVPTTATLQWSSVAGAGLYTAEISTNSTFISSLAYTTAQTSVSVSGLQYNTTYYWRVSTIVGGQSTSSTVWSFTTFSCNPVILVNLPSAMSTCLGSSSSITIQATGANLQYQWRRNGVFINAPSLPTLHFSSVTAGTQGVYDVFVIGACSPPAISNPITVTVLSPVALLQQPQPVTACPGTTVQLQVQATGSNLQYQWLRNGVTVSGATSAVLTLGNIQQAVAGTYSCVVSNGCNSISSNGALVTVLATTAITAQPTSVQGCSGATVQLQVSATGANLTYQWYRNNIAITGATLRILTITNLSASSIGQYRVEVSSTCLPTISSQEAQVSIFSPITIITQPQPVAVCIGGNATMSVNATGAGLSYQWRRNSVSIPNAIGTSITVPFVSATTAGLYDVAITDFCGNTVLTTNALLTMNVPPTITSHPTPVTVCTGGTATFSVAASGTQALNYQWRRDGVAISGATAATITVANIGAAQAGQYDCLVSNLCAPSGVASNPAQLTLHTGPQLISSPPSSLNVCHNTAFSLSVSASGTSLTYQWRRNGVNLINDSRISGVNTSTLTITPNTSGYNGTYDVVILGGGQCTGLQITSPPTTVVVDTLTLLTSFPTGIAPNNVLTYCEGATVRFGVTPAGDSLRYIWSKVGNTPLQNSSRLLGVESDTLQILGLLPSDAGVYRVTVTTRCGRVITRDLQLVVQPLTVITSQPLPLQREICENNTLTLSVSVSGTTPTSYQWRRNGIALQNGGRVSGANSATMALTEISTTEGGSYDVVIVSGCGGVITSSTVQVTVLPNTRLLQSPQSSITACQGSSIILESNFSGIQLTYQWEKDGVLIPSATSSTLQLSNVHPSQSGVYRVKGAGLCGDTLTSQVSLVTIQPQTAILTQPLNIVQCAGGTAVFQVQATGASVGYQWRRNGQVLTNGNGITGVSSATLSIATVEQHHAGAYDVVVTGICSPTSIISSTAQLLVQEPASITMQPVSTAVCELSNTLFSVTAGGTGISFQWYKDGVPLADGGIYSGSSQATLTLQQVNTSAAGMYHVIVSGSCGLPVVSQTALLTVNTLPFISSNSLGDTLCEGETLSLQVQGGGTGVQYQWYKNGTIITGATSSTYTVQNIATEISGIYHVSLNGICSPAVSSASMPVIVQRQTQLLQQPVGGVYCSSATVTLSVTATGSNVTYQWYRNSLTNPILGADQPTFTFLAQGGTTDGYFAFVAGSCGVPSISSTAIVIVADAQITAQPQPQTICVGGTTTFSVTATGANIRYQWFRNNSPVLGATMATYTITNASLTDDLTNWHVVVNELCQSSSVLLDIVPLPTLSISPSTSRVCIGAPLTLTAIASTTAGITYQWYKDGALLLGATSATYSIPQITTGSLGGYSVSIATPSLCAVSSAVYQVAESVGLAIANHPVPATICEGTLHTLATVVAGEVISYQWYKNNQPITGATLATLTLSTARLSDTGTYFVEAIGNCTIVTSFTVNVDVLAQPILLSSITNASICIGGSYTFVANVATNNNLLYEWRVNSVLASTAASFTISDNLTPETKIVSLTLRTNSCSAFIQTSATLTVVSQPQLSITGSTTAIVGQTATFGTSALTSVQWSASNNATILSAQNTSATIQWSAAGTAFVIATTSNACGTVTTTFTVTIVDLPSPILLLPTNNSIITQSNTTLAWQSVAQATSYRIELSSSATFATGVVVYQTSATALLVDNLANGTQYFWRVQPLLNGLAGTISTVRSFTVQTSITQRIPLLTGWNQIAFYVHVPSANAEILFAPKPNILFAQNLSNTLELYFPGVLSNSLTNISHRTPLRVYSSVPDTLTISGMPIVADTVQFSFNNAGWNILPYIKQTPLSASVVANTIGINFVAARSSTGQFYFPPSSPLAQFNSLATLEPGQVYQIFMNAPASFILPTAGKFIAEEPLLQHRVSGREKFITKTDNFMSVLISFTDSLFNSAEIIAVTETGEEIGAAVVQGNKAILTIFGEQTLPTIVPGGKKGEEIRLEIRQPQGNLPLNGEVQRATTGEFISQLTYSPDEVLVLRTQNVRGLDERTSLRISPIPAQSLLTVELPITHEGEFDWSITDMLGRKILAGNERKNASAQQFTIDIQEIPSGMYIFSVQQRNKNFHSTFMIKR